MKQQLEVTPVDPLNEMHTMQEWSSIMDQYPKNLINTAPWAAYSYTPQVSFAMAYTADAILLKYYVQEQHVRATAVMPNDLVYKDSCVEFFISFNGGTSYYNLEFNCIGTCYTGFGYAGKERVSLPVDVVRSIGYHAELQQSVSHPELIEWSLTIKVPLSVFINDSVHSLHGMHASANFYKCGDELPTPHYLTWNKIVSPAPDYHQPGFFGDIMFV